MKKLIKNRKKGFTLIEIIVVLVILAILAAAAIPTMIGFVNDSRAKALIAEARTMLVAGQTITTEEIAVGTTSDTIQGALNAPPNKETPTAGDTVGVRIAKRFYGMLQPDINFVGTGVATKDAAKQVFIVDANGVVSSITYTKIIGTKTAEITLKPNEAAVVTYK